MLCGVAALSYRNIIHGDVKPSNFLIFPTEIKLCDFGISQFYLNSDEDMIYNMYTSWFRPPEVALGLKYDCRADIWALACTIFYLYTGNPLFVGKSDAEILTSIRHIKGKPLNWPESNSYFSKERTYPDTLDTYLLQYGFADPILRSLMIQMLEYNPTKRIDVNDIIFSGYFSDFTINLTRPIPLSIQQMVANRAAILPNQWLFSQDMPKIRTERYISIFRKCILVNFSIHTMFTACFLFDSIYNDLIKQHKTNINFREFTAASIFLAAQMREKLIPFPDMILDLFARTIEDKELFDSCTYISKKYNYNIYITTYYDIITNYPEYKNKQYEPFLFQYTHACSILNF